jgi:hypothetical protein
MDGCGDFGFVFSLSLSVCVSLSSCYLYKLPSLLSLTHTPQVSKSLVIVELLLGDVPERALFRQAGLERPLRPYLQLTQVRGTERERVVVAVENRVEGCPCRFLFCCVGSMWCLALFPSEVLVSIPSAFYSSLSLSLVLICPQAVRVGDLQRFQAALESHAAVFTADRTYTLILRCAYAP